MIKLPKKFTTTPAGKQTGAYLLEHVKTGLTYAGSAVNLTKRTNNHLSTLKSGKHPVPKLQEIFNDDSNIVVSFCPTKTREEGYSIEQTILDDNLASGLLLNTHPDARGNVLLPQAHENARLANLGKKRSPESIEKTRQAHLGAKRSEDAKEKMRQASVGKNSGVSKTEEHRANISAALSGRSFPDETKEKLRLIALARAQSVSIAGVVHPSVAEASKILGITISAIRYRIASVNSFEDWYFL